MELSGMVDGFGEGRHVLLMEDNEINANIIIAQLTPEGYLVDWVIDGEKGLRKFEESRECYYSCVITDLMMPIMDGHEASRRIRDLGRKDSQLPILGLTANAFSEDLVTYKDCGINKCVIKPYDRKELLEWLRENISEYERIDVTDN